MDSERYCINYYTNDYVAMCWQLADKEAYRKAIIKVIMEARDMLGNPNISVMIDTVEYYYFMKV